MSNKQLCRKCGKPESEHCVFKLEGAPEGCVCIPHSWDAWGDKIPPICDSYEEIPNLDRCNDCLHDRQCHKNKKNLEKKAGRANK